VKISNTDDFTSHNTERLNQQQVIDLLLSLDYIQTELDRAKTGSRAAAE